MKCKQCFQKETLYNSDFCSRKCKVRWIEEHKVRGAKKRAQKRGDDHLRSFGGFCIGIDGESYYGG